MQIDWAFKGEGLADHASLLDHYARSEFDSPTRSTIPLLAFWRSPEHRIEELTAALALPVPRRVRLDFEHLVSPPRGKGKESHTDLMALSPEHAIAIEAKWTEPRYRTVRSWLGKSANRKEVLHGWCDLLGRRGGDPIPQEGLHELPYQMVHRAASACHADDASRSCLVYMVFEPSPGKRSEYLADLARLRDVLGPRSSLAIACGECSIEQSPSLAELRCRWDAGERCFRAPVLEGLKSGGLLRARLEQVHRLTP